MDLGAYLLRARTERGYSLRDVAEKSGFSGSKIKSMLLRTRRKLKKALEVEGLC